MLMTDTKIRAQIY